MKTKTSQKNNTWLNRINSWEDHVRRGEISSVQAELSSLTLSKIPRDLTAVLASIAFRAGLPFWSLKLLNPFVRPEKALNEAATSDEIIAYAGALFRVGLYQEGFELLQPVSVEKYPDALLQKAFGHFRQWDYASGVQLLKKFLKLVPKNEYRYLVGQVNLAAGLIFLRKFDEAERLTTQLQKETESKNFMMLYGNTLELLAQIRIFQNRHTEADQILKLAQVKLSSSPAQYSFYVKKWTVINRWLENHRDKQAAKNLAELRKSSFAMGLWETCRDCDYYEALKTRDPFLIRRLNFGTQLSGFRRRMNTEFGAVKEKIFLWNPADKTFSERDKDFRKNYFVLNPDGIGQGQDNNKSQDVLPVTLRRCFFALTKDFYRPISLGELFSQVYPGEYFNPFSSIKRLEITIRRLRKFFESQNIPLAVQVKNKTFRLVSTGDCVLEIQQQRQPKQQGTMLLDLLKGGITQKDFDLAAVKNVLDVSTSTAQRLLRLGVQQKRIGKAGYGRSRRFWFLR